MKKTVFLFPFATDSLVIATPVTEHYMEFKTEKKQILKTLCRNLSF